MKHRIAILIPYFGPWPEWIDFFIETCRSNSSIDWIVFNDQPPPENRAPNVRHVTISFEDYCSQLTEALGLRVGAETPYKLCDIRPALGFVHADLLRGYDFLGFGDLDVIYGDLRSFYDDELLGGYDLFSTHADRVSGHLCLMRNREDVVSAFRKVPRWKDAFRRSDNVTFDERAFYNLFAKRGRGLFGASKAPTVRCFFREAYSTPAPTEQMRWFWKDGRLSNEYYPHHPFMYLHFMSWHSSRWYSDQPGIADDAPAPWSMLENVVQMDWRDARKGGFMISPNGIQPIDRALYGA